MKKIIIWSSIQNGGDGSAYNYWYLTRDEAIKDQEGIEEGWAEPCIDEVETFVGSQTYKEAERNSKENNEE